MDIKKLEAIVKIEPHNPKHWFNLGIAYLYENRIDSAHKSFEESVKVNPYFAPSQFFLGILLLYGRDFKNGLKYLEKSVTIDENVYNKLNSDSNVRNILDSLIKASVKVIQDQLEFQPNNVELLVTMGKILLYTNSFESSINYFRKVIELKPDNTEAYVYLGVAYENMENYDQAIFYLKKAIVTNPYLAETYWILARIYQKIGNYGMALKNYEKAVEISPYNTRYLNSLANIYLTLEKNVQAIKTLQLAIDNNPNSKWSYYYLGQCLEKEYNFEIAMEQYEKALNIDPYFLEARIALAKLYQMNDPKRAIEVLEEVAHDYHDKDILYLLAQLYYSQKNFVKSLEICQQLMKISPDDYNVFYLYTLSLLNVYKQGYSVEKDILMKNLEMIYNKDPNNTVVSTEFFKLCVEESNFDKAKQILEKSNVNLKNKEVAEKVAFIYLQDQEYEKLINTIKTSKLFSFEFIEKIFTYLKEKSSMYLSVLYNQILDVIQEEWNEEQIVKFKLDYLEYLYFSNTLQALEFCKQIIKEKFFSENFERRYNLTLFELLIYFTLYTEYKDKKYLDDFINTAETLFSDDGFLDENKLDENKLDENKLSHFYTSQRLANLIKIVYYFYFLVIKRKHHLIPKIYDFLIKLSFRTNILINFLEEILPILLDNGYYQEVLDIVQKHDFQNISFFKKIKIETLFLLGKNNEVINETEEYFQKFSYDSYMDLLKMIADFEINGNYELYIDSLERIVMESNPLALAIYAKILVNKDTNEAIRYADRAMEFIYTGRHSLKNIYQIVMVIEILSRFYESVYKLSQFVKGLKQVVAKYPEVYAFNYLLAKILFTMEDFVDSELVAKKALKLTQSSNSLLQIQNLLSKIKEEKENYQKLLYELQKINPQIPDKIAYINALYKKDKIEEIYKFLEEAQENSIDNLIIRFYIFDKLEIKEQIVYHLNLLKIFAIENSLEALTELIENKLLLYSNLEELEEIKNKAEVDYLKFYKESLANKEPLVSEELLVSKELSNTRELPNAQKLPNAQELPTVEESTIPDFSLASEKVQDAQESILPKKLQVPNLSSLEDYYNLQEAKIESYQDFIIAYILKLIYIIFKDNQKYQQIENIIKISNIDYVKGTISENEKIILGFLDKIVNSLIKNDLKNILKEIKEFSSILPDQKFIILLSIFILNYLLGKQNESQKYMNQLKNISQNDQSYKKIVKLIQKYELQKFSNKEEISVNQKFPISQILDYKDIKNSYITSFNELIFAYLLGIFFLSLNQKENFEFISQKITDFENKYEPKEELQNHSLIGFLKKVSQYIVSKDIKSCILEIKSFNQKNKNHTFFINFVLLFLNYKFKRKADFEKLKKIILASKDKEPEFKNLISWIEKMEVEYENIGNK